MELLNRRDCARMRLRLYWRTGVPSAGRRVTFQLHGESGFPEREVLQLVGSPVILKEALGRWGGLGGLGGLGGDHGVGPTDQGFGLTDKCALQKAAVPLVSAGFLVSGFGRSYSHRSARNPGSIDRAGASIWAG